MAERSVVRYDETPDTRFFLCSTCHTHIALLPELVSLDTPTQSLILQKADNLLIDNSEAYWRVKSTTMAIVYCIGCFAHMGYVFVQVENSHDIIQEGRLVMDLFIAGVGCCSGMVC